MSNCNVNVIKRIGKYLNTPVGTVCYNTDKVLTTVLGKDDIEGFASIILWLAAKSDIKMTDEQRLLSYQWLEYLSLYADQAGNNPTFAKSFLQEINKYLDSRTYLTGNFVTIADIAAYHVLYSLIDRLSVNERESLLHVCRWFRHIQSLPQTSNVKTDLPKFIYPHKLANQSLEKPFLYYPQPFSYPHYPVVVYIR